MNYFEFYKIPLSFHPDQSIVKQQFYTLSKLYHPDFYITESEEKQNEVLELSTMNNKAFQILKDDKKVLKYILELKNMISEGEHYSLPSSFLMEMMDVNEVLMELQFDRDEIKLEQVQKEINQIEKSLDKELFLQTNLFETVDVNTQQERLEKIKEIFYRGNYIRRLKNSIAKFA